MIAPARAGSCARPGTRARRPRRRAGYARRPRRRAWPTAARSELAAARALRRGPRPSATDRSGARWLPECGGHAWLLTWQHDGADSTPAIDTARSGGPAATRRRPADGPADDGHGRRLVAELREVSAEMATARRCSGPRGRPDLPRRVLRRRGRDLRRGGLQHRHDRLPGDADRPVVPPPGRGDDRAAHRQHRRQRRGPRVRRIWVAGYVVRDPARVPSQLAAPGAASTTSCAAQGVVGISGIDTRALTRHLRERGAMRVGISSTEADPRRAAGAGAAPAPRWPAPSWPARCPRPRPTSSRRPARSGSPWPPSTSASRR